ncbi:MAG: substrate-binding domain-containing protein [Actinobacteria bacterium]|nr:substrate-binding domain-containing protein [Actinomycetota bacterium]
MKRIVLVLLAIVLTTAVMAIAGCSAQQATDATTTTTAKKSAAKSNQTLILATTTSTKDTGLLDELLPAFTKKTGITVKPVAVGTGEALKMGERGDADVLLVHARASEDEFMAAGFGRVRKDVMHNDFVLIGPANDPANVKGAADAAAAFEKIRLHSMLQSTLPASNPFVSRGDDSGTHKKEIKIWEQAGVKTDDVYFKPGGGSYISTGQGMAQTIIIANEKQGYTLADRGTYLVQKDNIDLVVLTEKSKDLLNPYGVIAVNPDKFPKVNYDGAMEFIDFLTSDEGRKLIGEFGKDKFGQALFVPDAKK